MNADKYEVIGPIFADIGGELAAIVQGNPDGVYLYAEAGEGWMAAGVFQEVKGRVHYFRPTSKLGDLILEAWSAEEPDKRWAVMEYEIKGIKFDVQFRFTDEIDLNESEEERRPRALKRRFGDKPIIYPPLPEWANPQP